MTKPAPDIFSGGEPAKGNTDDGMAEICEKCGFTYYNHIGNTGCVHPCWAPSGRYSFNKNINHPTGNRQTPRSPSPSGLAPETSTIESILTPERLAFMAKHGGMALPDIEVETSIGVVTLSIIARPKQ